MNPDAETEKPEMIVNTFHKFVIFNPLLAIDCDNEYVKTAIKIDKKARHPLVKPS